MSDVTIEKLQLEVNSNSQNAVSGIDALSASLSKLKTSIKGGVGLSSVARQITNLNTALNGMDSGSANKIDKLATSLSKLSALGQLKISSSIGNQLKNIGQVAENLNGADFSGIGNMVNALKPLSGIEKSSGLSSTIRELNKLPEVAKTLNSMNWTQFTQNIQKLTTALTPLATQLNSVSSGLSKLSTTVKSTESATKTLSSTNDTTSKSYVNLWAKARMAMNVMRGAINAIASWITSSNKYIEDLNLFSVSMGEYAKEAYDYANKVSEIMGIDPADWMRNQGVFNTIIKGFGVAGDKAALMSKNLTQLGYDISSFFNISYEDAMTKLQSGIAGELEPLRRLGYDLSVARLQQEAYTLGIEKKVSAMTQAEKSQLRYYAIMTQVTDAQGDMARTLNAPANQLRILNSQVQLCARSFGNLFIPILNAVLPYAIALAKALRLVAEAIANFFGVELPSVDWDSLSSGASAVGDLADNADDASSGLGSAAKAAKKLKANLLGIDELNVISPDNDDTGSGSSSGSGLGIGGDLGIDLPEYDFLGGLVESRIDGIVNKITGFFDVIKKKIKEGGVIEAFERLKEALMNFADSDFVKVMGEILNIVGDGVLTLAVDVLRDAFNLLADVFNKDLNRGVNDFKDLLVDITFDPLITLAEIVDKLTGTHLADWFKDVKDQLKNLDLTKLHGFEKLQKAIENLKESFAKFKEALQKFEEWLDETGISENIKKFVIWFISTNFDVTLQAIATTLTVIADVITILADILSGDFYSALNDIKNLLATLTFQPLETLASVFDSIFGTDVQGWLEGVEKAVKDFDLTGWFANIGTAIGDFFTKDIPEFWEKLKYNFEHPAVPVKTLWENALKPIKNFDWKKFGHDVGLKVGTGVKEICNNFKKFFTETLPETWTKIKKSFKTFFSETLPEFFTEKLPEWWKNVKESIKKFFTETLPDIWEDVKKEFKLKFIDVGTAIWEGILEGWNTAIKGITDFITGFVDGFKEGLGIHSPSTVFRDEIGQFLGEGILEGLAAPFKAIGTWLNENIVDPIKKAFEKSDLKEGLDVAINLVKHGWETVRGWIGKIPTLNQAIALIKRGWETVKGWIGNIPVLSQAIQLVKHLWTTVKNWIGNIPTLDQAIQLIKSGWSTVKNWIGNIPVLSQAIQLVKSGWETVKGWIGNIPTLNQAIALIKSGWTTLKSWTGADNGLSVAVSLFKSGWESISSWIGTSVSVGISLFKDGWKSLKAFFGLETEEDGGYDTGKGFKMFKNGGYISNNRSSYWGIPAFGRGGGINHGSMFVAGENGTEMVGRINGQTEVLNQSQIKLAMRSAVISGMAAFTPILSAINSNIVTCSNAVINSVLAGTQVLYNGIENFDTYDPTNTLSSTTYDDSLAAYRKGANDESMYSSMRDFYKEFVEPTLKDIAADTKRQADKEENINVQVGNRDITRAVDIQREANGYSFT